MTDKKIIPKMIFIIPFRDRIPQLNHFKYFMKYILQDIPEDEYKIYYIHQADKRPFNRGAIKNIGFLAMKKLYPNDYQNISFIFNDIDTLPSFKNLLDYKTTQGTIKHFYGFTQSLGGIISVNGKDFETMNGFPNFWAWGLEDNVLQYRAIMHNIKINRDNFYHYNNPIIINIKNEKTRIYSKEQIWRAGPKNLAGIRQILNLKYNFNNDMINIENFVTEVNPNNDTYYMAVNRSESIADTRYMPKDAINTISDFKKYGTPVIKTRAPVNKGISMKLF